MTTRAQSRRDPQKGKKGFSKNKGFTVIELMITIAVIAIIASLALPSYRSIVEKRQVTSAAEQLTAFLGTMKGEAVKLNEDLALSYTADSHCLGFQQTLSACDCASACKVRYDHDRNGTIDEEVIRSIDFSNFRYADVVSNVSMIDENNTDLGNESLLVYDSVRGMLDDDYTEKLSISLVSEGGLFALNVEIDRLGRIYICNPQSDDYTPVPGYEQCS